MPVHGSRPMVVLVAAMALTTALPVVILVAVFPQESPCEIGGDEAVLNFTLTPYLLANSPAHGYVNASYTIWNNTSSGEAYSGQGIGNIGSGSVGRVFENFRWVVYSIVPRSPGATCKAGEVVTGTDIHGGVNDITLPYNNDALEPNSTGVLGGAQSYDLLYYNNSFSRVTQTLSTCGTSRQVLSARSNHLDIGVPFVQNGSLRVIGATIHIQTNYTYTFLANAGTWAIDNLSAPGGPGGGWAFNYLGACN